MTLNFFPAASTTPVLLRDEFAFQCARIEQDPNYVSAITDAALLSLIVQVSVAQYGLKYDNDMHETWHVHTLLLFVQSSGALSLYLKESVERGYFIRSLLLNIDDYLNRECLHPRPALQAERHFSPR